MAAAAAAGPVVVRLVVAAAPVVVVAQQVAAVLAVVVEQQVVAKAAPRRVRQEAAPVDPVQRAPVLRVPRAKAMPAVQPRLHRVAEAPVAVDVAVVAAPGDRVV